MSQVAFAPPSVGNVDHGGPPLVERLPASFATMKSMLLEVVADLKQLKVLQSQLTVNYNHLIELSHVLQKCDDIFSEARNSSSAVVPRSLSSADIAQVGGVPSAAGALPMATPSLGGALLGRSDGSERFPSMPGGGIDLEDGLARQHASVELSLRKGGDTQMRLGYIAGVVKRAKLVSFERVIFRATRGNMYLRHAEITQQVRDPHSGELAYKSVFIIFFSGQVCPQPPGIARNRPQPLEVVRSYLHAHAAALAAPTCIRVLPGR